DAVGDLGAELLALRGHRGRVDWHVASPVQDALQRLAEARGIRASVGDLVALADELELLVALEDRADHRDVLAQPGERLAERHAVPSLDDLRARGAQAEDEAAPRQRVDGH